MSLQRWLRVTLGGVSTLALVVVGAGNVGAGLSTQASAPQDPVVQLAALFDTYSLVAIGESHQLLDEHRFFHELIRDARFHTRIDDIVVEFGNALYQDELDAYILGDHDREVSTIARVWRDTTQIHGVWDSSLYREFFAFVRSLNASLERAKRIRVIAADPPIDWDTVEDEAEVRRANSERDSFFAETVAREVIDSGRRALILVGGAHLKRFSAGTAAHTLEQRAPGSLHIVQPVVTQEAFAVWARLRDPGGIPSLAMVDGTPLERETSRLIFPSQASRPLQQVADSLLYLAPRDALRWVGPDAARDVDAAYCERFRERLQRWMPANLIGSVRHPCVE